MAIHDILLYKNRGKGLQTEFSLLWLKEQEEKEGPDSKMGYSPPYENKVARKSSDVHMQSHLEVLEIRDLQGKIQSPPPSIVTMLL